MVGAASLAGHFFRSQLVAALCLACIMPVFTPDGRGPASRTLEVVIVAGVLITGSVIVRRVSRTTIRHISELRRLALTDKLTGVLNRRGLADGFAAMQNPTGPDGSIGVISLDIGHFEWFNDTYGHAAGDEVLQLVCRVLRAG